MGRRRGKDPQRSKNSASTATDAAEDRAEGTATPPHVHEEEPSLQLPSPIPTTNKVIEIAAPRVDYVIGDTPRHEDENSASASMNAQRSIMDQFDHAEVDAAASTGHSSSDEHPQQPGRVHVTLLHDTDGPSYSKSFRRSTASLSPKEKIPHFMHPLRREVSPNSMPLASPEVQPLDAIPGLATIAPPVPRMLYKGPTLTDIAQREAARRVRLVAFENEELQDIFETFTHDTVALKSTIQRREKYLKSYEFAKCNEHGRQQRAKIEQWEAEKAKAEQEVPTFTPQISSYAAKIHPRRTVEGFLLASEQWKSDKEKRRRAASAVVFREEETTFHPKVDASSMKIAERLNNTSKRVDVVNGWAERLGAHKKHMEELQEKYACSFQPEMVEARRASLHSKHHRNSKESIARRKSASPQRRTVVVSEVASRLHDTAIEMRKTAHEKLLAERPSVSPKRVRRTAEVISSHLKAMSEADEKAQHRLKKTRDKLHQEESQLEFNSYRPVVNPNSVALADLNRQRRSLSRSVEASQEAPSSSSRSNIFDLLYTSSTAASNNRSSSKAQQDAAPQQATTSPSRHSHGRSAAVVSGVNAQEYPQPASKNITPSAQREFLLRNDKLLQTKELHRKDLLMQLQEFETRECTFAPALSSTTVRLAEYRRSAQRWDEEGGYPDDVSSSQQHHQHVLPVVTDNLPWAHSLRSETRVSSHIGGAHGAAQRSQSPKPTRPPLALPPTAPSLSSSGKFSQTFQRTDNGGVPYLRSSQGGSRGVDHHADDSSDTIQERMEDIEGLLRQWKWLEESSRM